MNPTARPACCLLAGALLLAPAAFAQEPPKYAFGKKEEVKQSVEWKASAQVGALGTYGNSQTITVNGGFGISRNDGRNKVTLDGAGAYAHAWVRGATIADTNANGAIDQSELDTGIARGSVTSAAQWQTKLRYDRFFTERNAGYVSAFAGQDIIAGKSLLAGGQIGYSRLLLKSEMHDLSVEVGYDLSYVQFSAVDTAAVLLHSGRFFVGYLLTLRKETAINASVEAFVNGNEVGIGPPLDPNSRKGFAEASRVVGKVGLTTVIYKKVSFRFGLTLKFDNAPAPIALTLPTDMAGNPLPLPGAVPRNEKVDFVGDAAIVVAFL